MEWVKIIGDIIPRDYCSDCAARANVFLQSHEFLRKACYDKFTEDREILIAKYSENGFKLPDVP